MVALLFVVRVQPVAAQGVVADLPLPSGGSERVVLLPAPQTRATVILLAGGEGIVQIDNSGDTRNGNFLVRTRALWQQYGINAVVLASPDGHSLMGQRHLPAYAAALGVAVDFARSRANAPVWLIGTSQGSTAAANGAAHLGIKVAGVVLTSSVTRMGRAGETAFESEPGAIRVPALVVSNTGDQCQFSPPGDGPRLLAALAASPRREFITVASNEIRGAPCEAFSPHGYLGIEATVVARIADWISVGPGR